MSVDIFEASLRGDTKSLQSFLSSGGDANIQNESGYTPLMAASHDGRIDCIRLLIENGADVNMEDDHGLTALTNAIQHSTHEVVELLLSHHANVNHRTKSGFTPSMFVAYNNFPPADLKAMVSCLMEAGADFSIKDPSGLTAKDHAKNKGSLAFI